jgi:hypothetical protein
MDADEREEHETYEEVHKRIKEGVYGSPVGLGEFLASDAITESPEFIAALLLFLNRRPASPEKLRDLLDDAIEQYAQREADDEQFNRPIYKPSFTPTDMLQMVGDIFRPASLPDALAARVAAARGIPQTVKEQKP